MITTPSADVSQALAFDTKSLGALRHDAKSQSPEATKKAAQQFEAMFINMLMKSMRAATPQEGMFENETTKTFTSMLDQQMSQTMSKRGLGLANVLVRQLTARSEAQALAIGGGADDKPKEFPLNPALLLTPAARSAPKAAPAGAPVAPVGNGGGQGGGAHVRAFQDKLGAQAEQVSRESGIPAKFMLGQAALETGWGKREMRGADGSPSHNLFGIKAGPGWHGKTVNAVTTEYVNGVPETRMEKFRAYDSYAESMRDYARMISTNPRYQQVMASAGDATSFAQGLQRAGYATDPHYASKLSRIIKHSLG